MPPPARPVCKAVRYTVGMPAAFRLSPHLLLVVLIALAAFGTGAYFAQRASESPPGPDIQGFLWPDPPVIGAFSLDDARGGTLDESALGGHWTLLFFGFTHCPDVCPTTLATMKSVRAALADLPDFAARGQVLFVSVDPARDTPEALRTYVEYFDPEFRAATAPPERLNVLTRQLGILYARIETGDPDGYTLDHTASLLLVSPERRLVGVFAPPHGAPDIAARVRGIVSFLGDDT